jgi:hypothetical protein
MEKNLHYGELLLIMHELLLLKRFKSSRVINETQLFH